VCAGLKRGEPTNMAIIELSSPSGYEFLDESLDELEEERRIVRWEPSGGNWNSQVNIYLDSLNNDNTCFTVSAYRDYTVTGHAKIRAKVYDYFQPNRKTETFYTFTESVPNCGICPFGRETCDQSGCT